MCENRQGDTLPDIAAVEEDLCASLLCSFCVSQGELEFNLLARQIAPRLFRYCRSLGSTGGDAEEVVQDVLYIVYRKATTVREPGLFWPWLYRVTRNALLLQVRRSKRQLPSMFLEPLEEALLPVPESRDTGTRTPDFAEWMEKLEPGERSVMVLRYVEDYEYHEIANALKIPIGTVKSRLFQAKKRLSKEFRALHATRPRDENLATGGRHEKR